MSTDSTNSNSTQRGMNRSWALVVLKTVYREIFPDEDGEIIVAHAQKVEEKVFEKAKSKKGYEDSISKAVDHIRAFGTNGKQEYVHPDPSIRTSKSSRTPNSSSASLAPGIRNSTTNTVSRSTSSTSRRSPPNLDITSGDVIPMHAGIRRVQMANRRKSLTPTAAKAFSRTQTVSTLEYNENVDNVQTLEGKMNFFSTKVDVSDVMQLVPFILEAAVQVIGKVGTVGQATCLTESEKSAIACLGMEKMSRTLEGAARSRIGWTAASKYLPLSDCERDLIILRAKSLEKEYMKSIRTIYKRLGEKYADPECHAEIVLNIGNCITKLDYILAHSSEVSKQTTHTLNYVENVFKTAIEWYGFLVHPVRAVRDNRSGASPTSASTSTVLSRFNEPNINGPSGLRSIQNSCFVRNIGHGRRNGEKGGQDDQGISKSHSSHCKKAPNSCSGLTIVDLKAKYGDQIKTLIPLVEAEIAGRPDRLQDEEVIAYVRGLLQVNWDPNTIVKESVEKVVSDFYEKYCYLLPLPPGKSQVNNVDTEQEPEWDDEEEDYEEELWEDGEETYDGEVSEEYEGAEFSSDYEGDADSESDEEEELAAKIEPELVVLPKEEQEEEVEVKTEPELVVLPKEESEEEIDVDDESSLMVVDKTGTRHCILIPRHSQRTATEEEVEVKTEPELVVVPKEEPEEEAEVKAEPAVVAVKEESVSSTRSSTRTPRRPQRTANRVRTPRTEESSVTPRRVTRADTPGRVLRPRRTPRRGD